MSEHMSAPRKAGIAVTGVLLGGVLVAGSLVGQSTAADSLAPQASAALQQAGITGVDVSFKGREAYLSGPGKTPDELAQAKRVVEAVHGVRWAVITGEATPSTTATPTGSPSTSSTPTSPSSPSTTSPSTTAPAVQPSVNVVTDANGTTLSGTVSSQAEADALAAQMERVFGGPVNNQIKVDPQCQDEPWVGDLTNALKTSPPITDGSLTANSQGLSVGGSVASEADAAALQASLATVPLPQTNNVAVKPPTLTDAEIAQIEGTAIQFGNGSFTLNAAAKAKLDTLIPLLSKTSDPITISGYVSAPHPAGREIIDSKRRAQAVADYLTANGIDASRITVQGLGKADPVASNSTRAGRDANQRAIMKIG